MIISLDRSPGGLGFVIMIYMEFISVSLILKLMRCFLLGLVLLAILVFWEGYSMLWASHCIRVYVYQIVNTWCHLFVWFCYSFPFYVLLLIDIRFFDTLHLLLCISRWFTSLNTSTRCLLRLWTVTLWLCFIRAQIIFLCFPGVFPVSWLL